MTAGEEVFYFTFRVRYAEIDGQSIVFNAHYLTYFDTAITEYFRALPYDYKSEVQKAGCDFHTVRSLVEYKKPLTFDETFDVFVRVGRIGRSSIRFDLEIHGREGGAAAGSGGDLRATGEVVWVYADQATSRPEPAPTALVDLIVAKEGDAAQAG